MSNSFSQLLSLGALTVMFVLVGSVGITSASEITGTISSDGSSTNSASQQESTNIGTSESQTGVTSTNLSQGEQSAGTVQGSVVGGQEAAAASGEAAGSTWLRVALWGILAAAVGVLGFLFLKRQTNLI